MPRFSLNEVLTVVIWILLVGCSADDSSSLQADEDVESEQSELFEDGDAVPDVSQNGSFAFSQSREVLEVENGSETLALEFLLLLPEGDGPFPLVVFTHGFSLSPEMYTTYGERLASWGLVAILPQMPGSLTEPETHRELADHLAALIDWATDPATEKLAGKLKEQSIGLAGHSMGGKISFLLASRDSRIQAVFGVDPVDSAPPIEYDAEDYPSVTPERMADISVPFVALGETTNGGDSSAACAPSAENFEQIYAFAESPAFRIEMLGANHMSFLDDPDCGILCAVCPTGTDDPAMTRALTQKYMTAFFLAVLENRSECFDYLTGDRMEEDIEAGWVDVETKNGFGTGL